MIKKLLFVGVVLLVAAHVGFPAVVPSHLTLTDTRNAIDAWRQGDGVTGSLPFSLTGYSNHWELRVGPALAVLLVSRNLGGTLLTFGEDGNLKAMKEVHELVSVSLFDFDGDGVSELITDELDSRGTGIVIRRFHIYAIAGAEIVELWEGISYTSELESATSPTGKPSFIVTQGYLRCDPPGGGRFTSRILHLTETTSQREPLKMVRTRLAFRNGKFEESP